MRFHCLFISLFPDKILYDRINLFGCVQVTAGLFKRTPARVIAVDDVVYRFIILDGDAGFLQQPESRLADCVYADFFYLAQYHQRGGGFPDDLVCHGGFVQESRVFLQQVVKVGHTPARERADVVALGYDAGVASFVQYVNKPLHYYNVSCFSCST